MPGPFQNPFADFATRKLVAAWVAREPRHPIPWKPLSKPLSDCTVALISSAGIARNDDLPFDQEGERRDPWRGDPSFRVLPRETTSRDVRIYHLHIDPRFGEEDLDCVLPLRRLEEAQKSGRVGKVAPSHYSFMGYLPDAAEFLARSVPPIIERLKADHVDLALLVPV